ncbi:hypothetical protein TRFO_18630 [Tritrichomonas foetus]|uniref:Uncharacterized protein n=1 Tax=Tritrichomonas foetus TaxID=1144522 RepID=A0A1J4KKL2_9EUKA|nr:hypothetical protein TRFO_18630 [Tritrichomonas foetus]|eukprot:OHT11831.1 hypothetical protein TRFO_18630 [Tritrichomonas foetus]
MKAGNSDKTLPFSDFIPRFWLSKHNSCGDLIKIPGDDEIYFIPMKSPLSKRLNQLFPKDKRWCVSEVMKTVGEKIKSVGGNWLFSHIELCSEQDPVPKAEWEEEHITHYYCPITREYKTDHLSHFYSVIEPMGKDYKTLYMVSCNNGHDRCGVAISMYLALKHDMFLSTAYYQHFKQRRWPGIYSNTAAEFLELQQKKDDPKKIKCAVRLDEFEIKNDDGVSESKLKIQHQPGFTHFGCESIDISKKKVVADSYSDLLTRYVGEGFERSKTNTPKQRIEFWNEETSLEDIKKHAYRCTFTPYGSLIFVMAVEKDTLVFNYGMNKFWTTKATIECPVPFICTAFAVETSKNLEIYLSDLLCFADQSQEGVDLDVRITKIYFEILPKITKIKADIKLKYRPLGRMTDAKRLAEMHNNMYSQYGFTMRGLSFLPRNSMPGRSLFLPLSYHVHLKFIMNATDIAVLYARSDDGSMLVPCKYFEFKERYGGLHDRIIRFRVNREKKWQAIAICKHELPDYISFVENTTKALKLQPKINEIVETIENVVREQAKKQEKKSKAKSSSSSKKK